jgi:hypothetical protein
MIVVLAQRACQRHADMPPPYVPWVGSKKKMSTLETMVPVSDSNRCLSLRLKRKQQCKTTCADEKRTSHVNWYRCFEVRVQGNYGRLHRRERVSPGEQFVSGRRERAKTLKTRAAVAVSPFPVPRCLPGNTSGEAAYNTPNII